MSTPKKKYYVYRIGIGWGCYTRNYKSDYIATTWAVSEKQACNYVRYKYKKEHKCDLEEPYGDAMGMGGVKFSLKAVLANGEEG